MATDNAPPSVEPDSVAPTRAGALPSEVVEFEAGGESISFGADFDADGTPMVSISERSSAYRSERLTARLLREHGDLTSLEMFYALAPEELEVPAWLLSSHASEVQHQGRESDAIRRVDFDTEQPIQKSSAACQATVFPPSGSTHHWTQANNNSATGTNTVCINNDCGLKLINKMTAGVCNESSGWVWSQYFVNFSGSWTTPSACTNEWLAAGVDKACVLPPNFGGAIHGYAVAGHSNTGSEVYHLRTGILTPSGPR